MSLILPDFIHSFIISLLFSSRTTSSNFEVVPLALTLLSFSFQNPGILFSVSILISSFCEGSSELKICSASLISSCLFLSSSSLFFFLVYSIFSSSSSCFCSLIFLKYSSGNCHFSLIAFTI